MLQSMGSQRVGCDLVTEQQGAQLRSEGTVALSHGEYLEGSRGRQERAR